MEHSPETTTLYPLLDRINSPSDLKQLALEDLPKLCVELRRYLLEALSVNPGHLGSNLGAVEATVAMHYVFDTPHDQLVWDVGHQAYIHKLLTGRRGEFHTLRKWGGLSGFPSPKESEYDSFVAGHASNSVSAALGMAVAAKSKGERRRVVAFIGDGSMTGGMAFEGLNNASSFPNNLLIILNDNNMSIDKNVGGLNKYMVDLLTSRPYNCVRRDFYHGLMKLRLIKEKDKRDILGFNNKLKSLVSRQNNLFDSFSIRYFGPVDGNDVLRMVHVLNGLKNMKGPKILHISTVKGKGYEPAEKSPTIWHAPGKFDPATGQRMTAPAEPEPPKFQDVFGETLVELARMDERIVGITPAMPSGCSMNKMMEAFPDRAYDVGIAEEHAVTFSSGLASGGMIPFCNIYSTFMQRAYDQMIHDVALQGNKVIFCLDRAGLVGEDGATHQGAFDLSYLRSIPDIAVCSPMDEAQLRHQMYSAYKTWPISVAIRYPRGQGSLVDWRQPMQEIPFGKGRELQRGSQVTYLSIGPIGVSVAKIVAQLRSEGVDAGHIDMVFAKPLDEELLEDLLGRCTNIVTVEEATICGGLGSAVAEFILDGGHIARLKRLGIPDRFISHGTPSQQRLDCGLDDASIREAAEQLINR
ncbi:MAG: 1-deoxy-D-xylulose-5-phosphate synthase [Porphyromonadaceae bacterium]|nr:1-deoxy-D-xylulose-5-phosphate synthase [Porphyromonadaceae bacterium]